MHQIHRAGEKLFIDYAGPTVTLPDGSRAHIFIGALGTSSYTFAYATARETTAGVVECNHHSGTSMPLLRASTLGNQ